MELSNDTEQGSNQNLSTALGAPEKTRKSEQCYILVQSSALVLLLNMEETITQLVWRAL
jgi:hypothetical protein